MSDFINLIELVELAKAKFKNTTLIYDYYLSGAGTSITYHHNRKAFDAIQLVPRFMMGKGRSPETTTAWFGQTYDTPIGFAPVGYMRLTMQGDEVDAAHVAKKHNIPMCLSASTTRSVEDVAAVGGDVYYQLYFFNRNFAAEFVERSEKAGCKGIIITIDSPVVSQRDGYHRYGISVEHDVYLPTIHDSQDYQNWKKANPTKGDPRRYIEYNQQPLLTWDDVRWLVEQTTLPVIVKGVLHPDDARLAVDAGAQAIVVSNHGGRQLDTAVSSIEALPAIAKAVGEDTTIILDGGVRRGTDIIKALALGATSVLIGQPLIWGLVMDGQAGIDRVYTLLHKELIEALVLCGYGSTADIDRSIIFESHRFPGKH